MKRYSSRTEFVLHTLASVTCPRRILDIGFIGEYEQPFIHNEIIRTLGTEDRLHGIDIGPGINKYKDQRNVHYSQLSIFDVNKIPEMKGAYDCVILCEVFEHLPHPYLALHRIHHCLKYGGMLVMTYPNPIGFRIFMRYLFTKNIADPYFISQYRGAEDHKIFPMPSSITAYLNETGYCVTEIAFPKGKLQLIPVLEKFSSYVGLVAVKKKPITS